MQSVCKSMENICIICKSEGRGKDVVYFHVFLYTFTPSHISPLFYIPFPYILHRFAYLNSLTVKVSYFASLLPLPCREIRKAIIHN